MSDVLVGSAYATMQLRYEQFTQGVSIVEQQIARLQALSKTPIVVQAQIAAPQSSGGGGAGAASVDRQAADYTRLQRAQAALEAQQARLARTQGDTARAAQLETQAQQRLTSELQAQTGVTTQSIAIERQLATVQQQSARAAQQAAAQQRQAQAQSQGGISALGGALSQLKTIAGGIGIAVGAQQIVSAGFDAGQAALALRETKNGLRAVAGDLQTYNQTLAAAREQQRLFGGSLQENIEGLSGLTITARSSGAQLQSLISLSQRLAVLDPAQGAQGARIALNEALSGDPTSLAKRYEIPRAALAKLRDTTLPVEERLKVIDAFLTRVGITAESVAGKVDQDALAFRTLGQELETARLSAGDQLATAFSGAATGLARVVGIINANPRAIAELQALFSGKGGITQADIDKTARDLRVGSTIGALDSAREARTTQAGLGGALGIGQAGADLTAQTTALEDARSRLVLLSAASDESRDRVAALLAEFGRTGNIDAFVAGLRAIETASARGTKATQDANDASTKANEAFRAFASGTAAAAQASALDAAQKDLQSAATSKLAFETKTAADAFLLLNPNLDASQAFAAAAAQGLSPLVAQVVALRIEADKTRAALLGAKLQNQSASSLIGTNSDEAQIRASNRAVLQGERAAAIAKAQADAAAAEKARTEQLLRTGSAAQVVAQRQREYNEAVKQFGKDSAQAITAQTTLIEAQQSAAKAGGAGRVSAAQTTAQQLNTVEQNSGLALLKTQRENLERLRDQQEDFDVKRARRQEDFEAERRRLLAQGQRGQAARLAETFARDQRREQEDFDRQKRRTLRNNQEGVSDIDARTDLRSQQISDRARLRGVRTAAPGVDLGQAPPTLGGAQAASAARIAPQTVAQIVIQGVVNLDGKAVGTGVWPTIEVLMDEELAISLAATGAPGSGQQALAGVG